MLTEPLLLRFWLGGPANSPYVQKRKGGAAAFQQSCFCSQPSGSFQAFSATRPGSTAHDIASKQAASLPVGVTKIILTLGTGKSKKFLHGVFNSKLLRGNQNCTVTQTTVFVFAFKLTVHARMHACTHTLTHTHTS